MRELEARTTRSIDAKELSMRKLSTGRTRRITVGAGAATVALLAIAGTAQANPSRMPTERAAAATTSTVQAISTSSFLNSIGVNTHLDFGSTIVPAYADLPKVEKSLTYLGLKNVRDSGQGPDCAPNWEKVAQATGVKFDDFMGEDSAYGMYFDLGCVPGLAKEGILNYVEGGNEEDDPYAANLGNTLAITAKFQQQVYATAQALKLPTINMSFGAGWTAANDWHGDYDKVGDLSPYTDYANAHDYPVPGATADTTIQQLNGDAHLAASSKPIMITEFGYDTNVTDPTEAAAGTLDATLDATKDGDSKIYFYALYDDTSGNFGLMNTDATPKPAGLALHNLTTLLSSNDHGHTNAHAGSLAYSLTGSSAGDNNLLLQGSDGTYWLALWNETQGEHDVTVNLGCPARRIATFNPLNDTAPTQSARNSNKVTVTIPRSPVLVHIQPEGNGQCR